jgi:hypothetical protein
MASCGRSLEHLFVAYVHDEHSHCVWVPLFLKLRIVCTRDIVLNFLKPFALDDLFVL